MNLDQYFDNINRSKELDYWFMTKQTVSDLFIPLYCCYIADDYEKKRPNHSFSEHFESMARDLGYTENAYRNKIIPEYMGLLKQVENAKNRYSKYITTNSFQTISKYIKTTYDLQEYSNKVILTKQLEKIALNVYQNNKKYNDVKNVTLFPLIFMYAVLLQLKDTHQDPTISWDEFIFFIIRAKRHRDIETVVDLIVQYRNSKTNYLHKYQDLYHYNHKDMRLNNLLKHSIHLKFYDNTFRLDSQTIQTVRDKLHAFRKSSWKTETDKTKIMTFMQSSVYFDGTAIDYDLHVDVEELDPQLNLKSPNIQVVVYEPIKSPRRMILRELKNYSSFSVDPLDLQKATLLHEQLVDDVAMSIKQKKKTEVYENETDLYYFEDKRIHIMEMKTITEKNWKRQLRTALGQILQYEHLYFRLKYPHYEIIKYVYVNSVIDSPDWKQWISFLHEFNINLIVCES